MDEYKHHALRPGKETAMRITPFPVLYRASTQENSELNIQYIKDFLQKTRKDASNFTAFSRKNGGKGKSLGSIDDAVSFIEDEATHEGAKPLIYLEIQGEEEDHRRVVYLNIQAGKIISPLYGTPQVRKHSRRVEAGIYFEIPSHQIKL